MDSHGEQLIDVGRGVTLCCERFGDPAHPPLLLIAGLGQQLLSWPEDFCEALTERGFHVVRFDNRDAGRSWHAPARPPGLMQLVTRRFAPGQYDLADMAQDTANLIEALGLEPVHAVGVSMGGMIGQTLAARHPGRVRRLVSIMSSTGGLRVGRAAPSTLPLMFKPPARDRDQAADRADTMWRHIGSHGFPYDEAMVRDLASRSFDRDSRSAAGAGRQIGAITKSGDRRAELRQISVPTLVVHGDRDRMVHPSGGRSTAETIPGARLETIQGMGHDLPLGARARLIELIADHATGADGARAAHGAAGGAAGAATAASPR
jgi:pimeloyl-ACP methyl ester carboxylesterase